MQEWISQTLESQSMGIAGIAAALMLGVFGAVTNCCNVPVLGAIVGYSGTMSEKKDRRDIITTGLFFMLGTIIALGALGAVAGFISQTVESRLGMYWKLIAGIVLVFLGLAVLNLVPFKLPKLGVKASPGPKGMLQSMLFGLAIGGGATACTVGCNPVLLVALGAATLQGSTVWGAIILGAFAIGYSLPLGGALIGLGLGFGKLTSALSRFVPTVNGFAGIVLIGVGFYFLATVT